MTAIALDYLGADDADARLAFVCGQDAGDALGVLITPHPNATRCPHCTGGWVTPKGDR